MCMHGRLVGVATVCMHSSCVINLTDAWPKEPEDRCMQNQNTKLDMLLLWKTFYKFSITA